MSTNTMSLTVLLITGMRANACREHVARVLEHVPGVKEVNVNLYRARAIILHEPACVWADLVRAVDRSGYPAIVAPLYS